MRNPVDAFIAAKLQEKGLRLSPEADRLTLIRRASFDLTGLPPEPEEVRRFLADPDPAAYESLVERLLDSPRYGERWGRHWLDLVGYSDRRHAWRYRDYVIRSFNAGKPYDRFLLEQLAGDELADLSSQAVLTREAMDNLIATGFLRMVNDVTGNRLTNFVSHRIQVISEQIQIFSSSLMGLTMGCARCHNHKFDPIPQRDYYRLAALFKGAFDEHDWLPPAITDDPNRPMLAKETRVLPFFTPMSNPFRLHDEECPARIPQRQDQRRNRIPASRAQAEGQARGGKVHQPEAGRAPRGASDRTCAKCWTPHRRIEPRPRRSWPASMNRV